MNPVDAVFTSEGGLDPFAPLIQRFVSQAFPIIASRSTEDVMENVMEAFLGTKQTRIGPRPNPESLVMMRDVVRGAVENNSSIPVYIPSAAVKVPVGVAKIDVAELAMLRQIDALNERVMRFHPLGLNVRIRMEDLTELVLSGTDQTIRAAITDYTTKLQQLVTALSMEGYITLVPESSLVNEKDWLADAAVVSAAIHDYLKGRTNYRTVAMITDLSWPISLEMREYFHQRYEKLYPNHPDPDLALAAYFGSTLTRRRLRAQGHHPGTTQRLELSFGNRLPDFPPVSTRVHYRTVPMSQTKLHIPPWQAKGFFRIAQDDAIRLCVANWHDTITEEWQASATTGVLALSRGDHRVEIQADYVLE